MYSTVAGFRPLTSELLLPPKPVSGGAPVIIYVHGGGWMSGHTRGPSGAFENWPGVPASLFGRGYVGGVAQLSPEQRSAVGLRLSGTVKLAVRWLRSNAERFSIDKRQLGIWGGSTGGHSLRSRGPVAAFPRWNRLL